MSLSMTAGNHVTNLSPRTSIAKGLPSRNLKLVGVSSLVKFNSEALPNFGHVLHSMVQNDPRPRYSDDEGYAVQHKDIDTFIRTQLFDWLIEVGHELSLKRTSVQLALIYADEFLSMTRNFANDRVQLLGITTLAMAAKLEEIYPPSIREFAVTTDKSCSVSDIVKMERIVLRVLGWNILPTTYFQWVEFILFQVRYARGCRSNDDIQKKDEDRENSGQVRLRSMLRCLQQKPGDGRMYQSREARCQTEERLIADTMDLIDVAMLDMKIVTYTRVCVSAAALCYVLKSQASDRDPTQSIIEVHKSVRLAVSKRELESCYTWLSCDISGCSREGIKRRGHRTPRTRYKELELQSFNGAAMDHMKSLFDYDDDELEGNEKEEEEEAEEEEEEEEEEDDGDSDEQDEEENNDNEGSDREDEDETNEDAAIAASEDTIRKNLAASPLSTSEGHSDNRGRSIEALL
eukprot:g1478.t1